MHPFRSAYLACQTEDGLPSKEANSQPPARLRLLVSASRAFRVSARSNGRFDREIGMVYASEQLASENADDRGQ